jgi:CheY-like chemotaxis protein
VSNIPINEFGKTAKSLSRNPLGIIALFIVLIYGVAGLVTAFSTSLTAPEKVPLLWFLVIFPVIVLVDFTWLVCNHSNKLYSPSDFRNEENYVRMQLNAVASLTAANSKSENNASDSDIESIVDVVRQSWPRENRYKEEWHKNILWVDDRPNNNIYERRAFESIGLSITIALSTQEALNLLNDNKYALIISDMSRQEGSRAGYVLLDTIRNNNIKTPFLIYSDSNLPQHQIETINHGGQGASNNPQELFRMAMKEIIAKD